MIYFIYFIFILEFKESKYLNGVQIFFWMIHLSYEKFQTKSIAFKKLLKRIFFSQHSFKKDYKSL
jgi:hypothetical protein